MEFTTATDYDMKTLTAMAKALRKTVRKRKSRRAHIFGWIVVLLGTLLLLPPAGSSFSHQRKDAPYSGGRSRHPLNLYL